MRLTALFSIAFAAFGIVAARDISDSHWKSSSGSRANEYRKHAHSSPFLSGMSNALEVMQDTWYQLWIGTWPTSIDWTAAVLSTYVFSSLQSLSAFARADRSGSVDSIRLHDRIGGYYDQLSAFYFGENAFALRNEANDDALWVVLNWLEGINFASTYSSSFRLRSGGMPWHGVQYTLAFAHRARIFYDIASKGWNTTLCDGGMIWNNRLGPYKNAITNELWISASTEMYMSFPGDNNSAPYMSQTEDSDNGRFNREYLENAERGYSWLKHSKMTDAQGLYVDGFHITGWTSVNHTGTGKCDARNEMVYTYNQGVILSGLRGLWEATGDTSYLKDAHKLVRNVMKATGWAGSKAPVNLTWAGLGRSGILEDYCDASGTCSQDSQTFKGIFMNHLTRLCHPLPRNPRFPGKTHGASHEVATLHLQSCRSYGEWVQHNAVMAGKTRDVQGKFGSWWSASLSDNPTHIQSMIPYLPEGAVDYFSIDYRGRHNGDFEYLTDNPALQWSVPTTHDKISTNTIGLDPNDRGRGRTVETQGGGLAVMRAAWEFSQLEGR